MNKPFYSFAQIDFFKTFKVYENINYKKKIDLSEYSIILVKLCTFHFHKNYIFFCKAHINNFLLKNEYTYLGICFLDESPSACLEPFPKTMFSYEIIKNVRAGQW